MPPAISYYLLPCRKSEGILRPAINTPPPKSPVPLEAFGNSNRAVEQPEYFSTVPLPISPIKSANISQSNLIPQPFGEPSKATTYWQRVSHDCYCGPIPTPSPLPPKAVGTAICASGDPEDPTSKDGQDIGKLPQQNLTDIVKLLHDILTKLNLVHDLLTTTRLGR